MASTFLKHYARHVPRFEAREKRYRAQSVAAHAERLTTLVEQLDPGERQQIDAEIARLDSERKQAERFDRYNEMTARHQAAFRSQVQKARAARLY
ncbi:hypothetical protein [Dictyobacter kobayashii]|uniref:Uncharacterized protein n=1 Tax=Dictyobacter kobayashii TaxID=2014872 RepID=A0A402AIQ8_9CHLR|nr:hypothetical protein [Dictyobacter kobayashii]GCE18969.1 hypothetical protein KDK_27690 [Dictyobacter kobayashii]